MPCKETRSKESYIVFHLTDLMKVPLLMSCKLIDSSPKITMKRPILPSALMRQYCFEDACCEMSEVEISDPIATFLVKESYAAMAYASSPSSMALPAASVARLDTALVLIM